jgi:hypothetical protein
VGTDVPGGAELDEAEPGTGGGAPRRVEAHGRDLAGTRHDPARDTCGYRRELPGRGSREMTRSTCRAGHDVEADRSSPAGEIAREESSEHRDDFGRFHPSPLPAAPANVTLIGSNAYPRAPRI